MSRGFLLSHGVNLLTDLTWHHGNLLYLGKEARKPCAREEGRRIILLVVYNSVDSYHSFKQYIKFSVQLPSLVIRVLVVEPLEEILVYISAIDQCFR